MAEPGEGRVCSVVVGGAPSTGHGLPAGTPSDLRGGGSLRRSECGGLSVQTQDEAEDGGLRDWRPPAGGAQERESVGTRWGSASKS